MWERTQLEKYKLELNVESLPMTRRFFLLTELRTTMYKKSREGVNCRSVCCFPEVRRAKIVELCRGKCKRISTDVRWRCWSSKAESHYKVCDRCVIKVRSLGNIFFSSPKKYSWDGRRQLWMKAVLLLWIIAVEIKLQPSPLKPLSRETKRRWGFSWDKLSK